MMAGFLLDTNHLGAGVTPGSIVRQRVVQLRSRGIRVGTCVPVLCEIEAGIQQLSHPVRYRQNMDDLLRQFRIWPIDPKTAEYHGMIHRDLRRAGRILSQFDMMLAAMTRQMRLTPLRRIATLKRSQTFERRIG